MAKVINALISATESAFGRLFVNAQQGIKLIITLLELDRPQPLVLIKINNSTVCRIMNNIKKK